MRKLTVMEFKNFCKELSATKYIFYSENQTYNNSDSTLGFKLTLNYLSVTFNPNTIRLVSSDNYIDFKSVKYVKVEEPSVLGVVLTIVCENDSGDRCYTIIAQ